MAEHFYIGTHMRCTRLVTYILLRSQYGTVSVSVTQFVFNFRPVAVG